MYINWVARRLISSVSVNFFTFCNLDKTKLKTKPASIGKFTLASISLSLARFALFTLLAGQSFRRRRRSMKPQQREDSARKFLLGPQGCLNARSVCTSQTQTKNTHRTHREHDRIASFRPLATRSEGHETLLGRDTHSRTYRYIYIYIQMKIFSLARSLAPSVLYRNEKSFLHSTFADRSLEPTNSSVEPSFGAHTTGLKPRLAS